jgi:UDP-N-acetylmuramoylalanine--D-glutamate ligase
MSRSIVILGSGESGMGAAQLAVAKGDRAFLSDYGKIDTAAKEQLSGWGVEYEEEQHSADRILSADLIVKSPGIPDNVSIVKEARSKGINVISEIEYAFYHLPAKARVIAITGTNGKTTTTLLTHHLFTSAGLDAALGGNVGISFARQVAEREYDYYVIEVSSFQLDGIIKFRPDVGILLNITPDHLDRYEDDFQKYVASKFRIVENLTKDECFIYCSDNVPISKELVQRNVEACMFAISATKTGIEGAFVDNEHLIFNFRYKEVSKKHQIPISEINLIGKHNMINTMAAVLAALTMDVSIEKILKGLKTFQNAPHRLEVVDTVNGVKYINDSKATNVDSVKYALDGIHQPIVWIAGGIDKGNDYDEIRSLVDSRVKALICLGTDNSKIRKYFEDRIDIIEETGSMKEAVRIADELSTKGDAVLLSPACASFDLFKNYEDRGDQFRLAVQSLNQKITQS